MSKHLMIKMSYMIAKRRRGTERPAVTLRGAEPRLSRPGRRTRFASAGARMRSKPHDMRRRLPSPCRRRRCGIRVLQGVRSRRTRPAVAPRRTLQSGRGPTDAAARSPRAQWSRRYTASRSSRFSADRGVVDGSRTRDTQVISLVLYPLSYHDLAPPRFRIPARNTPRRPSEDGARRAAGPARPAAPERRRSRPPCSRGVRFLMPDADSLPTSLLLRGGRPPTK